jgi:hypothetical protein
MFLDSETEDSSSSSTKRKGAHKSTKVGNIYFESENSNGPKQTRFHPNYRDDPHDLQHLCNYRRNPDQWIVVM